MKPHLVTDLESWKQLRAAIDLSRRSVGFVPTMGALHAGHRSLLERARRENEIVVLSIFVNPTQFNDPKDLERYPRDLDADLAFVGGLADHVLAPAPFAMYPDGYRYRVTETDESTVLEGAHRPGHFDGVLTVVLKLLNIVQPHRAYFGEKDRQQLDLVAGMVKGFHLPVEIVACPTIREDDGLALSSRNARLSPDARRLAPAFSSALRQAPSAQSAAQSLTEAGFGVDYVEDRDGVRLGAVRIGDVRLIDNVRL